MEEATFNSDLSCNEEFENSSSSSDNEDFTMNSENKTPKKPFKILESTEEFLAFASQNKKVKILLETSPMNSTWALKDISLHKKGPLEDKIYAKTPMFYYNIRRGNTIIEIYEQKDQAPKQIICRRGLRKFYDLSVELFEYTKALANPIKDPPFLTSFQKKMRKIIFENIEDLRLDSKTIWKGLDISKIYKENGEHCQISYITLIDAWLVASKNVTILLKTPEDLQYYNKERHYWPKIIAETWFEYLQNLSPLQIIGLKEALKDLTLLGEHCGHPKHTHIIKYNKIEIIFYAIVENLNPKSSCLYPETAFSFFKKFGLKHSKMEVFSDFNNYEDFLDKMENLLKGIELSACEKEGEGSVIYISYQEHVISLCKMKTIEYLVFRNLREHLKKQIQKPNFQRKAKYNEEVRLLFKGKDFQKSRDYYIELGKIGFEFIDNPENKVTFKQIYYCFVDLLKIFLEKIEGFQNQKHSIENFQLILLTPPLFLGLPTNDILKKAFGVEEILTNWHDDENFLQPNFSVCILHLIPRVSGKSGKNAHFIVAGFSQKMLEKSLDFMDQIDKNEEIQKNPGLFAFLNKTDRKTRTQKLELLRQKIPVFLKSIQSSNYSFDVFDEEELLPQEFLNKTLKLLKEKRNIDLSSNEIKEFQSKELFVFLPFGIPGIGKSYFSNILSKILKDFQNVSFYTLSIDKIREEIQNENPDMSHDYLKTVKETTKQFYFRLSELLVEFQQKNFEKQLLYLDKNHTPSILKKTLECLYQNMKDSNVKLRVFGLIPSNSSSKLFTIKEHQYPFSTELILICLYRCLSRENHETLDQDPVYRVKVFLKFIQIFRNVKLKKLEGFEKFIEIPFAMEGGLKILSHFDRLLELITKALEMINPKFEPKDSPIFLEIAEEFYKVFKNPPEEIPEEKFRSIIAQKIKDYLF